MPQEEFERKVKEVITSMPESTALMQAQIAAMRQLSDGQALINRTLERMHETVEGVKEDVTFMKGQNLARVVEKLESEIEACVKKNENEIDKLRLANEAQFLRMTTAMTTFAEKSRDERAAMKTEVAVLKSRIIPILTVAAMVVTVLINYFMQQALNNGLR